MAIILYNSLERDSRDFVAALPANHTHKLVDWYRDREARYAYDGPPPSDFPCVVQVKPDGTAELYLKPSSLKALGQPLDRCPRGKYVGGVTLAEAERLAANPEFPERHKRALAAGLLQIDEMVSAKLTELGASLDDVDRLSAKFEQLQQLAKEQK